MKKIILILALAAGVFAGYVDFISEEVFIPVLLILGFTIVFGYLLPSIAWRLALLVGIGVPLVAVTAYYLGYEPAFVAELRKKIPDFDYDFSKAIQSLLALVPSFIGAYGGALIKKIFSKAVSKAVEPPTP